MVYWATHSLLILLGTKDGSGATRMSYTIHRVGSDLAENSEMRSVLFVLGLLNLDLLNPTRWVKL